MKLLPGRLMEKVFHQPSLLLSAGMSNKFNAISFYACSCAVSFFAYASQSYVVFFFFRTARRITPFPVN
jgi:hypothetical protein